MHLCRLPFSWSYHQENDTLPIDFLEGTQILLHMVPILRLDMVRLPLEWPPSSSPRNSLCRIVNWNGTLKALNKRSRRFFFKLIRQHLMKTTFGGHTGNNILNADKNTPSLSRTYIWWQFIESAAELFELQHFTGELYRF